MKDRLYSNNDNVTQYNWVFFQNSSPGESNLLDAVVEFKIIENPNFSIDGGFYDDPVKLDLSLSNNSDEKIILYK